MNRILNHNDITYLIISLSLSEGSIKCVKLYDKNGIKINIKDINNINNAQVFSIEKLYENSYINDKDESDRILQEHNKDDNNILRIYYELISLNENVNNNFQRLISRENIQDYNNINENNSEDIRMKMEDEEINSESISDNRVINNKRTSLIKPEQKEIMPYKITPENIDLNNYKISIIDNQISAVQSILDESYYICYESKLIKEQSSNEIKGLVSNSIMKVYTSIYNRDIVNIVHIHLNDTSKEISVDSKFLEKSEMINDHKIFKLDAYGKKLDYKLIFRDFNVIKIIYINFN